jgi:hypothetical protein
VDPPSFCLLVAIQHHLQGLCAFAAGAQNFVRLTLWHAQSFVVHISSDSSALGTASDDLLIGLGSAQCGLRLLSDGITAFKMKNL